jgi:hypothetical protein
MRRGRMDKDPETLEEALKVIKGWKRLYSETLNKVATARADALRDAADKLRTLECVNGNETEIRREDALAIILADKQEEK